MARITRSLDLHARRGFAGAIEEFAYFSDERAPMPERCRYGFLSKLCKRSHLALSGEGADELFAVPDVSAKIVCRRRGLLPANHSELALAGFSICGFDGRSARDKVSVFWKAPDASRHAPCLLERDFFPMQRKSALLTRVFANSLTGYWPNLMDAATPG